MRDIENVGAPPNFEEFIKGTGWGLYYKFIVGMACTCNFIQAATFVTIPLALGLSSCDPNFIPFNIVIRSYISFYVGGSFGGLITNSLSDRYGRKKYLTYSLMIIFFSTFTAAFAYNPYVVIGATFFLGVGLETNLVSLKLLLIEILPKESRGFYIMLTHVFWTLGYIITVASTLYSETSLVSSPYHQADLTLTTWRLMFAVCGGANILLACVCALLEESPRYFLHMGRNYLAFLVLKQLYAINNSSFADNFKVREEELANIIRQYDLVYLEPRSNWLIFKNMLRRFIKSLKLMFSKGFFRITIVIILLKIPVLVVSFLFLNIFLSKKLTIDSISNQPNIKYVNLDFVYPVLDPTNEEASMCADTKENALFYRNLLIVGSAIFPGILPCMFVIDKVGRKLTLFSGFLTISCSFLVLAYTRISWVKLIGVCLIMIAMSIVTATISLVNLELYPTAIRGTAYGVTNFFGLFLAIFFVIYIAIDGPIFSIIMGILYFCLFIFTCFLPETKGKPMVE